MRHLKAIALEATQCTVDPEEDLLELHQKGYEEILPSRCIDSPVGHEN